MIGFYFQVMLSHSYLNVIETAHVTLKQEIQNTDNVNQLQASLDKFINNVIQIFRNII